jgi:transcription antitermination protein NusB
MQHSKPMGSRRRGREAALQVLYQVDLSGEEPAQALSAYFEYLSEGDEAQEFAGELVRGWAANRDAIDAKIREVSRHWRLERMARVDRNVLRLATFELLYLPDVPRRVTLNEAVELAKRFGDEDSSAFVNGVLDRIASDTDKS